MRLAGVLGCAALLLSALALPGAGFARGNGTCTLHLSGGPNPASPATAVDLTLTPGATLPAQYTLERSDDGASWAPVATVAAAGTACTGVIRHTDSGLTPATTYWYRVGATVATISTAPPPLVVRPVGDPAQAVFVNAAVRCTDTGTCYQWADVENAPFGGSFRTVGDRVGCGTGCGRYNVRAGFTYADGHTARLEIVVPEGYSIDDSFPELPYGGSSPGPSGNIGGADWLAGDTLLGINGSPLLVLCSDYPVNPSPAAVAQNVGAFAELAVVSPADSHAAWIYFVRTGGFTPACGTSSDATSDSATYHWGQLWSAGVTAKLFRHGRVIKRARLGSMGVGHHHWSFAHRRGAYRVLVCGKRARKGATNAHACIQRTYAF